MTYSRQCTGYYYFFFFGDGGLVNYLPGLALNYDPPDFSLPSS
jgi:hypothetical protein